MVFQKCTCRANYTNLQKNIHETTEYLEVFIRNLLFINSKSNILAEVSVNFDTSFLLLMGVIKEKEKTVSTAGNSRCKHFLKITYQ